MRIEYGSGTARYPAGHRVRIAWLALVLLALPIARAFGEIDQAPVQLLAGEYMAVAYSGYRAGQHPDRGAGASNPSDEQILADLRILLDHGFDLIRIYDSGENSAAVLRLVRQHRLPIKVLLGIWLKAELSNHEDCAWLTEPIPQQTLAANRVDNAAEIERGISLAAEFPDIVVAVNVGNEALVEWNDHMVPLERVIEYVQHVKHAIEQPVTVAENYDWWVREGAPLAAVVDFVGVHSYPQWEHKSIDQALAYTIDNMERVQEALPGHTLAILEAGWATTSSEFPQTANEENQRRYFHELEKWAQDTHTTVFIFEGFDEPWKGDADNALGAEKHWGLFFLDRTPKLVMRDGR